MLTGRVTSGSRVLKRLIELGWGRMYNKGDHPETVDPYPGEPWGLDNGAYADGTTGRQFDADHYMRRLDHAHATGLVPYINVVPDIYGGKGMYSGVKSLEMSYNWIDKMPNEWPNYLVVQDRMTQQEVSWVLDKFDGIFVGGSDSFKGTSVVWGILARQHGIPLHIGRAGTLNAVRHARRVQADSIDSTTFLWTAERFDNMVAYINDEDPQQTLIEDRQ